MLNAKTNAEFDTTSRANGAPVWIWKRNPSITIRERRNSSGGTGYRVTFPASVTGGRVVFVQKKSLAAAQEIAAARGRDFQRSQSTALILGDAEKIQAASALDALTGAGIRLPLDQVAREYADAATQLAPFGYSIEGGTRTLARAAAAAGQIGKTVDDLVAYAIERLSPAGGIKTLGAVVDEMIELKRGWLERGDLRKDSLRDFESRAGRIKHDIGSVLLGDLTKEILYEWLRGLGVAHRTVKNYRMILSEVLKFAEQKKYLLANPVKEFTRHDVKELEGRADEMQQPAVLTPAEARRLIEGAFAQPELDLGAAVTLGLFAGIRTEELKRLRWSAVRLNDPQPIVVIGPEIAKKRRIRNVPLNEAAAAWLRKWRSLVELTPDTPIARSQHANDYQKRFQRLCRSAGIAWEKNAMRHSFATYHYARHGDSIETSRLLGHKTDDTVLFAHYRALSDGGTAEQYFALRPAA